MKRTKLKLDKRAVIAVLLSTTFTLGAPFAVMAAETEEETQQAASTGQEAETNEDFLLGGVVVTATRTPVEQFRANANVSVITAADIEKNHWTNLSEALRNVPGVSVRNYAAAGYQSSNTFYINGSPDVVFLVDGVKMGALDSSNGKISPSMFANLDNIERIEVLKGSGSTLYGSFAKGGVVNIITKKIDGVKNTFNYGGGSFGTQNFSFNHQGRQDGWSWRFHYQKDISSDYEDAKGKKYYSRLNATTQSFLLKRDFNSKSDLTVTYDSYKTNRNEYESMYTNFNPGTITDNHINNYDVKAIYNFRFNDKTSNQLSYQYISFYFGTPASNAEIETQRISDQFTRQINDAHTLTTGFEYTEDNPKNIYGSALKETKNTAVYIQDEWKFAPQWKLTGGLRYDDHSGFGEHTSPSVNLGYEFNDNTNMYISYNEYFIAPSISQLYHPTNGNPNVKPESGDTSEIGINHKFSDTLVMTAHMFKRNSENRIQYDRVNFKYGNVKSEKADGWDIQLKNKFSKYVSAYVGYTRINVDQTGTQAVEAKNVGGYLPKGVWNIGIDYSKDKFNASLLGRGIMEKPGPLDPVGGNSFPESTYWLWDIGFNYRTSPTTKIFLKVNNIFDKYYAEQTNTWYSHTPGEWWTMPGRNFTAGVQYTF